MKVLVMTANFGGYDTTLPRLPVDSKSLSLLGFISGNENKLISQAGNAYLCYVDSSIASFRTQSRILKLYPTPLFDFACKYPIHFCSNTSFLSELTAFFSDQGYTHVLWVDSNCRLAGSEDKILDIVSRVRPGEWGVFSHPDRDCAYKEAKCVKGLDYISPQVLKAQMNFYKQDLFPQGYGLYACNFIVRSIDSIYTHSGFWLEWLSEYLRWASRDQLSLPYVLFKNPLMQPRLLGSFSWKSDAYSFVPH